MMFNLSFLALLLHRWQHASCKQCCACPSTHWQPKFWGRWNTSSWSQVLRTCPATRYKPSASSCLLPSRIYWTLLGCSRNVLPWQCGDQIDSFKSELYGLPFLNCVSHVAFSFSTLQLTVLKHQILTLKQKFHLQQSFSSVFESLKYREGSFMS